MRATVSQAVLVRRSHGLKPGERFYCGSTSSGLVLSDLELTSLGKCDDLRLAHTWTNETSAQLVLWIYCDPASTIKTADLWTRGTMPEILLPTFHLGIVPLGFEWMTEYFLWITTFGAIGKLSLLKATEADLRAKKKMGFPTETGPCKRTKPTSAPIELSGITRRAKKSKWVIMEDGKQYEYFHL